MPLNQSLLDRIRHLNKVATNKLLIHLSGKRFGHLAILTHAGRKSGKKYRIPIIAEPFQGGFVIALTYGRKVDWYANVKAQGGCTLRWKNRDYRLVQPEFIDPELGVMAFPALFRGPLRKMGVGDYLKLEIDSRTGL
jgi:deazaflavin-dependent oxidoreductase (nitroreductase family)